MSQRENSGRGRTDFAPPSAEAAQHARLAWIVAAEQLEKVDSAKFAQVVELAQLCSNKIAFNCEENSAVCTSFILANFLGGGTSGGLSRCAVHVDCCHYVIEY